MFFRERFSFRTEGGSLLFVGVLAAMAQQHSLHSKLLRVGESLSQPSPSTDDLHETLQEAASLFSEIPQAPSSDILEAMKPLIESLARPEFLTHNDREIALLDASCISEIMRIVAPNPPYSDDVLREVFKLIVSTFQDLDEIGAPSFPRRVSILETVSKVRSCVVLLDLEFDDLILQMFQVFFRIASEELPQKALIAMRAIMTLVIQESEDVPQPLLEVILNNLVKKKEVSPAAHRLAMAVLQRCSKTLEPYVEGCVVCTSKDNAQQSKIREDSHDLIYEIYRLAPSMVFGIIPSLRGELLSDEVAVRVKAVRLLERLFALPGNWLLHDHKQLFSEFVERFTDQAVDVQLAAIDCAKTYLLVKPYGKDTEMLSTALKDRLQDCEIKVRMHAVLIISDIFKSSLQRVPMSLLRHAAELLRDKEVVVRRATLQSLIEVYRSFCLKCFEGSIISGESLEWIPCKILDCSFDESCRKLRPEAAELLFPDELFPSELSVTDRVKHWIFLFLACNKNSKAALKHILSQKQQFQHEMHNFLSRRQKTQEADPYKDRESLDNCCKNMSMSFPNPAKAEENFQHLNQLKDSDIWKALEFLLDPNTTYSAANTSRDELLRRLGREHPMYDFMKFLTVKCSYIIFGKEHMKSVLDRLCLYKTALKQELLEACMSLFMMFAEHFPVLLEGADELLMQLLEGDNENLKGGMVQILAKSDCLMCGHFLESSGLILEKLCLEGSRKEAKYAVQALAGRGDSGTKTLSQLYLKLVGLLQTTVHLPTVLQSLAWIAQCAMPLFETREDDITDFVLQKLFTQNSVPEGRILEWGSASRECHLKVYGLKILVRSFSLNSDSDRRKGIEGIFGILGKLLTSGEIYDDVMSSDADKAYLRLAAAKGVLRLSKYRDAQINPWLFHSTVLISQDLCPHVQQAFLGKVHQYIKEQLISCKYACAFPLYIPHAARDFLPNVKQYMIDFIDSNCYKAASLQQLVRTGESLMICYPEYVIFYFVHVLAHHISFPATIGSGEIREMFSPVYRQFCFLICLLLRQKENVGSEIKLKNNGNASVIISIFRVLKGAEDCVDASKSQNGHILADIGILIIKELLKNQSISEHSTEQIALPSDLYKVCEGLNTHIEKDDKLFQLSAQNDGSDLPAYLLEDNLLLQIQDFQEEFNSMNTAGWEEEFALQKQIGNHHVLDNAKEDSDEMGIATTSENQDHKTHSGKYNRTLEGLSRQSNKPAVKALDQPVMSSSMKKRGHARKGRGGLAAHEPNRKRYDEEPVMQSSEKRKRGRPKGSGRLSDRTKLGRGISSIGLGDYDETAFDTSVISKKPTPGNLSSASPSKKKYKGDLSTKSVEHSARKSKLSKEISSDILPESPEDSLELNQTEVWQSNKTSDIKSTNDSLVGRRIKVWWPLDKEFYEGVVESFDPVRRKHLVCYADGDVEFLQLSKERWELIEEDDVYREESTDSPSESPPPIFPKMKGQKEDAVMSTGTLKTEAKEYAESSPSYRRKRSASVARSGGVVFSSPTISSDSEPFGPSDSNDEVDYNVANKTGQNVAGDNAEESNAGSSGDERS